MAIDWLNWTYTTILDYCSIVGRHFKNYGRSINNRQKKDLKIYLYISNVIELCKWMWIRIEKWKIEMQKKWHDKCFCAYCCYWLVSIVKMINNSSTCSLICSWIAIAHSNKMEANQFTYYSLYKNCLQLEIGILSRYFNHNSIGISHWFGSVLSIGMARKKHISNKTELGNCAIELTSIVAMFSASCWIQRLQIKSIGIWNIEWPSMSHVTDFRGVAVLISRGRKSTLEIEIYKADISNHSPRWFERRTE